MKTDDLARPLVGKQGQVQKSLLGADVGNIGHPDLVWPRHLAAPDQILKHRKIGVKTRGPGPFRGFSLHQQSRFAQLGKEPVPAHFHPGGLQFRPNQVIELAHPQSRLLRSFCPHQRQHQPQVHGLPATSGSARVIILRSHVRQFTQPNHFEPGVLRDREVRRRPTCFFLKASAVSPICSHATARKAFSKANSICASASASLAWRSWLRSRVASFISSAFSTRITLPYLPLPYCRTHRITVCVPLMLYLRCTAQALHWPVSTSLTSCILKPLLYLIMFMLLRFCHSKVPTYFSTAPHL